MIDCQICQDVFNSDTVQAHCFECGHLYCLKCIRKLRKIGCPLNCRPSPGTGSAPKSKSEIRRLNVSSVIRVYVDFTDIAMVRARLATTEADLGKRKKELDKKESRLEKKEAELAKAKAARREEGAEPEDKEGVLEEMEAELGEMEEKLQEKASIIRELEGELAEKEVDLKKQDAELEEQDAELEEKDRIIQQLREQIRQHSTQGQSTSRGKRAARPRSVREAELTESDDVIDLRNPRDLEYYARYR
ncbi:hypothetical protein FRC01_012755 [Tulasnella sp. 417]|nr:hypothetical protein FRC01_012755 [Tulasnella sp. 417]